MRRITTRMADDRITGDAVPGAPPPDDMPNSTGWTVTLRHDRTELPPGAIIATLSVPFYMGSGLGTTPPEPVIVLDCLLSDAAGVAEGQTFEEWCAEYGYDSDSRRAERTYNAVKEQTARLREFLGDAFDVYLWETERL